MAVQPSNSALRVAQVLTALAATEGRDLSLSELAEQTGMNKTTCQSTLLALVQTGYADRDDRHKTYRLGPAVLALSTASGTHQHALAFARRALVELAEELDIETAATVATDRVIVKVARVLRPGVEGLSLPVGQSVALAPPFGAIHIAWAGPARVRTWLARRAGGEDRDLDARTRAGLEVVRHRGYAVTLDEDARRQLVDIDATTTYPVNQIAAPVFDDRGRVVLAVSLMEVGMRTGELVHTHADRLLRAAASVTRSIGGSWPDGTDPQRPRLP